MEHEEGRPVETADGSLTYYSAANTEHYHSLSGAREEAMRKYVEPLALEGKKKIRVIDFCFGLGYNTAALIERFAGKAGEIEVTAFENDHAIVDAMEEVGEPFRHFDALKEMVREKDSARTIEGTKIAFRLVMGDLPGTLSALDGAYDAVLFDPFSPRKMPRLWTEKIFETLYAHLEEDAMLTTYSCAKWVRENMRKAGFEVKDGPVVGRRAPGTIARKRISGTASH